MPTIWGCGEELVTENWRVAPLNSAWSWDPVVYVFSEVRRGA